MANIVEMRIRLTQDENGHEECQVMGPLQNKVLCLGMLEFAKKAVLEAQASPIIPVAAPPGLLKS